MLQLFKISNSLVGKYFMYTKREQFHSPAISFLSGADVCFPEFAKKVALLQRDSDFGLLIIKLTRVFNPAKPKTFYVSLDSIEQRFFFQPADIKTFIRVTSFDSFVQLIVRLI